jgi:hypothetical protein
LLSTRRYLACALYDDDEQDCIHQCHPDSAALIRILFEPSRLINKDHMPKLTNDLFASYRSEKEELDCEINDTNLLAAITKAKTWFFCSLR